MSAGYAPPAPKTFTADGALTQFTFAALSDADNLVVVSGAGLAAIGVVVDTVADGQGVSLWLLNEGGIVPIRASAEIALGAAISSTATGEAVTAGTGDLILGTALEAASGDGHVIAMLPAHFQEVSA